MGRKFSIDIPKLKIGPLRPESRQNRHQQQAPQQQPSPQSISPESPPTPVPQSLIRLPSELDAELRAACTWVVENYRPSHNIWCEATKPALDYAAIQDGLEAMLSSQPVDALAEPRGKYSYKPDVPVDELFKHENVRRPNQAQLLYQQRNALLRADQPTLTAVASDIPAPRSMTVITHSEETPAASKPNSSSSEKSELQTGPARIAPSQALSPAPLLPKAAEAQAQTSTRPVDSHTQQPGRRQLTGYLATAGSSPYTDGSDRLSGSTIPTSAAITPGRASKRASALFFSDHEKTARSASAASAGIDSDMYDSKWMHAELEKQRSAHERGSRPQSLRPEPSHHQLPSRGREQHPVGRPAEKAVQPVKSQEHVRAASNRPGSADPTQQVRPPSAQRSRGASVTQHVREYFRPGSSLSNTHQRHNYSSSAGGSRSRKPSSEALRTRGASIDSVQSTAATSEASTKAFAASGGANGGHSRWRPWKSAQNKQYPTPEYSRPPSATGFFGRRRAGSGASSAAGDDGDVSIPTAPIPPARPVINLNRELPPLPSLDTWKPEAEEGADVGGQETHSALITKQRPENRQQQQQQIAHFPLDNVTIRQGRSRDVLDAQAAFTGVPRPYKSSADLNHHPAEWSSQNVNLSRSGPGFATDPSSTLALGRTHEASKVARPERDRVARKPVQQPHAPEARDSCIRQDSRNPLSDRAASPQKKAPSPGVSADSPTVSIRHVDTAENEQQQPPLQVATVATYSPVSASSPHGRSKSLGGATLINIARTSTVLSHSSACTNATEYHTPRMTHSRQSSEGLRLASPVSAAQSDRREEEEEEEDEQRPPVSPLSPERQYPPRQCTAPTTTAAARASMIMTTSGPSIANAVSPTTLQELDATARYSPISSVSPLSSVVTHAQPLRSNAPSTRHIPFEIDVNYNQQAATTPPATRRPHAASAASLLVSSTSYTHSSHSHGTNSTPSSYNTVVSSQQQPPQGPQAKDMSKTRRRWWSRKERPSVSDAAAFAPSPHRRGLFAPAAPVVAPVPPPPQQQYAGRLRKGSIPLLRSAAQYSPANVSGGLPYSHQQQQQQHYDGQQREHMNRMSRVITS